jgi:hypothetical protein
MNYSRVSLMKINTAEFEVKKFYRFSELGTSSLNKKTLQLLTKSILRNAFGSREQFIYKLIILDSQPELNKISS